MIGIPAGGIGPSMCVPEAAPEPVTPEPENDAGVTGLVTVCFRDFGGDFAGYGRGLPPATPSCPRPAVISSSCRRRRWSRSDPQAAGAMWEHRMGSGGLSIGTVLALDPGTLGEGSHGCVRLARPVGAKEEQEPWALKIMEKGDIVRCKQVEQVKVEAQILATIKHPFIMQCFAAFHDETRLFLLMEYLDRGGLFSLITRGPLNFKEVRFYSAEIVLALEYLHGLDIAHRDLKHENVLFDRAGHVRIVDFGFAKVLKGGRSYTCCGTPQTAAPEIFMPCGHGKGVDWWALGVMMYEMFRRVCLISAGSPKERYRLVWGGHVRLPWRYGFRARSLVAGLLRPSPEARLGCSQRGAEEVKAHRFFSGVDWEVLLARGYEAPFRPSFTACSEEEEEKPNLDCCDDDVAAAAAAAAASPLGDSGCHDDVAGAAASDAASHSGDNTDDEDYDGTLKGMLQKWISLSSMVGSSAM